MWLHPLPLRSSRLQTLSADAPLCMQVNGALDAVGMSGQTPVLSCNYTFDLNRSLAI